MGSPDEVSIGYLSTIYHTSFILKGTNWLENRLGIKAYWKLFGGGPAIVDAFEKNDLDIGYIGLPPTMIGIDRGVNIKCISAGHMEGTVFVGKNSFKSLAEMNGDINATLLQFRNKTIGSPPKGSIHDVIIRNLIKTLGLENKIIIRNFGWADFIPDAIADRVIDAAVGTPPLAVLCARTSNSKIIIPPNKLWPYNPSYGIVVSTKLIDAFPEFVMKFLELHENATNLIQTMPEKAAEIITNLVTVIDKNFVLETYKISPKYCTGLPTMFIKSTMDFVPVLRNLGYLKKELTQDEIFDFRFAKKLIR